MIRLTVEQAMSLVPGDHVLLFKHKMTESLQGFYLVRIADEKQARAAKDFWKKEDIMNGCECLDGANDDLDVWFRDWEDSKRCFSMIYSGKFCWSAVYAVADSEVERVKILVGL